MPVRDAAATTSALPSFPAFRPTVVSGDRLLLVHISDSPSGMGTPSGGWAPLASVDSGQIRTNLWWRTAGSSEPSSYGMTQGGVGDSVVIIASISGAGSGTPRVDYQVSSGDQVTTPGLTLPSGTGTEVRIGTGGQGAANSAEWLSPPGFQPEAQARSRFWPSAIMASRTIAAPGPTGEATFHVSQPLDYLHGITVLFSDQTSGGGGSTTPPPTVPALPSGEKVVHYTYEFADLLTDELICKDLDLHGVAYSRRISEPGEFSASLKVTDAVTAAKVARIVPRHPEDLSTGPGRSVVHVYRNGVIWGTYVIWGATVSRNGRGPIDVSLTGTTLDSYLSHVKIREDVSYQGWDQIDIARDLVTRMQSTPRYNIGLVFQAGTSGVTRDREYLASDASTYGERLSELGNVQNGYEWTTQVVDNGDGTRTRHLVWGAPVLGNATTSHVFAEPGDVSGWSESIDATRGGTAFQTRGESVDDDASTTAEPLTSQITLAEAHLLAGWPGLDVTADYSSVSETDTLDAYAQWWATNRAGAVRVHQATVMLRANTSFGPGQLGDRVTLMLSNPWWPITGGVASFAKSWRVVGMDFTPPEKGSGQEFCALTFEELAGEP